MRYHQFITTVASILEERPELIDCTKTNLYRALEGLSPSLPAPPTAHLHRCHLASQWAEFYGLPSECSSRALVSCGVRHSLQLIFQDCAKLNCRVWLPEDNYPVFQRLAEEAGLAEEVDLYRTLPTPVWPDGSTFEREEFLLLTNPIKPLGRSLAREDITHLKRWLSLSSRRRIIIDSVYSAGQSLDPGTMELALTSQAIVLHSLTKSWLHPQLFGVAWVPKQDRDRWSPIFRASPPPQDNLMAARCFLSEWQATPSHVADALQQAQKTMSIALKHLVHLPSQSKIPAYLFPISEPWETLQTRGVLGIPASVFGSKRNDVTILSSLHFADHEIST